MRIVATVLKVVAWVYLAPAIALLLYTQWRVFRDLGWWAYTDLMSPWNLKSYLTIALILAPGILILLLSERLKARGGT